MSTESDIRAFLASRRAKITPQQAGLPAYGGNRRVPGLRREEVALLAGVSIDYYVRLERGHLVGASDEVLDAVANALQLDDAERAHLFDLARAAAKRPTRRTRRPAGALPDSVLRVLTSMTDSPAFIRNGRLDVLATNTLGRALYAPCSRTPPRRPPTSPALSSSPLPAATSSPTGKSASTPPSPCCAPRQAAPRTTPN